MAVVSVFGRIASGPATWLAAGMLCLMPCAALGGVPDAALGQATAPAQPQTKQAQANSTTPTSKTKKRKSASHRAKAAQPAVATAPVLPPAPPLPKWPANDQPAPAKVSWNGHDLTIAATNASLQQILTQVSSETGVKVDGEEPDQRIFGSYGPAPARDVLSQLLDGSGYNVLIIGDKGAGTPRELVLSARTHAATTPAANAQSRQNSEDETPEEPEPQPEPANVIQRRPIGLQPGQVRTPEQLQEEQQQRLEQLREQQQQQQTNPPPPKD